MSASLGSSASEALAGKKKTAPRKDARQSRNQARGLGLNTCTLLTTTSVTKHTTNTLASPASEKQDKNEKPKL